jgi:hypothetical protein
LKATPEAFAKLLPAMVTVVPTPPLVGLRLVTVGTGTPGVGGLSGELPPPPQPRLITTPMRRGSRNSFAFRNIKPLSRDLGNVLMRETRENAGLVNGASECLNGSVWLN